MSDFAHLHTHSYYSLLDGLSSPEQLVLAAKEAGQTAMALTDHGALYGLVDFYQAARKHGIKPILGVETYVAADGRFVKKAKDWPAHLVLLAKTDQGYRNLLKLISLAHVEGFYYRPRVDYELLHKYGEGLIATSACLGGEILNALSRDREDDARAIVEHYQGFFGKENFFIELQPRPEIAEAREQYPKLIALAKDMSVPMVGTNDIHYARRENKEAHDVLLCVQTGKFVSDVDRMRLDGDFYVQTADEMAQNLTASYGAEVAVESMANSVKIAEACNVEIPIGTAYFPRFETPGNAPAMDYLREVTYAGFEERYGITPTQSVARSVDPEGVAVDETEAAAFAKIDRMLFELSVIEKMGFPTYFLIFWDFIKAAREMGVVVGPGRGSAAGSIVTYALAITDLDPLKYNLLFERFLNPDRISLPDIDVDFADTRRADVLRYVEQKYGHDRVAQVCTFGRMMARAVIRDVGRVQNVPLAKVNMIAKLIPTRPGTKLKPTLETDAELKAIYANDPEARKLLDLALQLEGCVRHVSTHACAVVIAPDDLTNFTPIQHATREEGQIITQYAMGPVEAVGLVKMDFLGLRNLSIIELALKLIKKIHDVQVDLKTIGDTDPGALELLGRGLTTGVFQFESQGMRRYLKELKPTHLEDLIAMVALYRPGPLETGFTDMFVRRKLGKEAITVDHPLMANALKTTYGVVVYQEQVMQISKDMAGFTGGQADTLRKGMGKKIPEVMAKMRKEFVDGSVANGVDAAIAGKVFTDMEHFAGYAFNKSHAACYALIAYQTAYLKAHYTTEFMAALLTCDMDSMDRLSVDLKECQDLEIQVLPPSVNESFESFTVVAPSVIRFGLSAIKNLGSNAVAAVIAARKAGGPFTTLDAFLKRVDADSTNKKSLEALAKAGAFEGLSERKTIIESLDHLTTYAREAQGKSAAGQADLFSLLGDQHKGQIPTLTLPPVAAATDRERLAWEKEVLGMFVSDHPLASLLPTLERMHMTIGDLTHADEGKQKKVAGMISTMKRITTKGGDTMMFATVEDLHKQLEVVIFPRTMQKVQDLLVADIPCIFEGKVSFKDSRGTKTDDPKLLLDSLTVIDDTVAEKLRRSAARRPLPGTAPAAPPEKPSITFTVSATLAPAKLLELKQVLMAHRGETPCVVAFAQNGAIVKRVALPFGVNATANLQVAIEAFAA